MTAATCSRVTPDFTVTMTITPVVVGDVACAWAWDACDMQVRVRKNARTRFRIGVVLRSRRPALVRDGHDAANAGLESNDGRCSRPRDRLALRERPLAIMLIGHEAG